MKEVEAFTDGACSGNPGPGGWGVVLRYEGSERELCGGENATTNNRMELLAAIEALSALDAAMHRSDDDRLDIRQRRHYQVAPELEEKRLENCRQETGEESGLMDAPRRTERSSSYRLVLG